MQGCCCYIKGKKCSCVVIIVGLGGCPTMDKERVQVGIGSC